MRAHPRSRGEHFAAEYPDLESRGSSPLTRGAQERQERWRVRPGLIPAHAGSTWICWCSMRRTTAHPRSRGEHDRVKGNSVGCQGSSPLTRGARLTVSPYRAGLGLIPAHAGSTECAPLPGQCARAHPRSRGEHPCRGEHGQTCTGSSPLTRGAQHHADHGSSGHGLIPAHAGSTSIENHEVGGERAHPRSRGEH